MKPRVVWIVVVLLFAVYFPLAAWLNATYVPILGPPHSAGAKTIIVGPFTQYPDSPFAATIRDRGGLFEAAASERLEVWEDDKKLGHAQSTLKEITEIGLGRYLVERGRGYGRWVTFASSDNSNPATNGRKYWLVNPPQ
jgi:hypothetical protein